MKLSRFLKDVDVMLFLENKSHLASGFSEDSSLCVKPARGPAEAEDNIVYSVTLSRNTCLGFEEHGLIHTWQFHRAEGLKGCQTAKATTGSCKFSVGERLACRITSAASKGFSVLFKYQQESENGGIPQ